MDLFDWAEGQPRKGARRTDPETSHLADAEHPSIRRMDRWKCLVTHFYHPAGLTDYELADYVGRQQNSAGKRRGELRDAGLIMQTEQRRPTPAGSSAIVWRITAIGWQLVKQKLEEQS